jgi:elongation factor P
MAMTGVNRIKRKNVIRYNNEACLVLECTIRTPPNNASYCQMSLRNLKTGKQAHVRTNVGDSFDVLLNEFRSLEFLYENQGEYVFMDQKSFEQFEIGKDIIADYIDFLIPNQVYQVMFVENNPTLIDLPSTIDMTVTEAVEGVRGDTATNLTKQVTTETGLKVNVPLFIKQGDKIRVSAEDRSYMGRVNA